MLYREVRNLPKKLDSVAIFIDGNHRRRLGESVTGTSVS